MRHAKVVTYRFIRFQRKGFRLMSYHFSKTCNLGFDDAVGKISEDLKNEGFGILTEIDVQETLKKKLNVDFRKYRILGACNPAFAYEALQAEDRVGAMLPCNVIIQERGGGIAEISAIDPVASMMAIENPALAAIAGQVRSKLKKVIENL
jgi:uncharacterized protein (DUF302 family)